MKYIHEYPETEKDTIDPLQINESLLTQLIGGATGVALGKIVGEFFIKAFGLTPNSALYKIFKSRLVWMAIGSSFGKKDEPIETKV